MFRRGEVTEWPKVPDSKSGVGQPTAGSNPALSAARGSHPASVSFAAPGTRCDLRPSLDSVQLAGLRPIRVDSRSLRRRKTRQAACPRPLTLPARCQTPRTRPLPMRSHRGDTWKVIADLARGYDAQRVGAPPGGEPSRVLATTSRARAASIERRVRPWTRPARSRSSSAARRSSSRHRRVGIVPVGIVGRDI